MAFIIKNGTGGSIEIEDLGITLEIGELSDLSTRTDPQTVALSMETGEELHTLITVGSIIVKDPLDGVTDLSIANALICLQSINDPHFRVGAGALLGDISDVDLTGLADNYILEYDNISGTWLATLNSGGTGISRSIADVNADSGTFAAVGEDTFNINGGLGIDTSIIGDTLSINLNAVVDDLQDVDTVTTPPVVGSRLVWKIGTSKWEPQSPSSTTALAQMFEIVFSNSSTVSNSWIDSNGTPSNEAPPVCGWEARLAGITFTNNKSSISTNIQIYRTAEGAAATTRTLVETWSVVNARTARKTNYTVSGPGLVQFFEGDKISVYFEKPGGGGITNPRGVTLILHFIITDFITTEVIDNWTGDISDP